MTIARRLQRVAYGNQQQHDSQYGSLPIGEANYLIPTSGVIYVATSGSDASPGTVSQPKRTLKAALDSAVSGSTIIMRGGDYHEGGYGSGGDATLGSGPRVNDPDVTIQNYPGETVWMDGSQVVTGWTQSGSNWVAPFVWTLDRAPTQVRGEQASGESGGTAWGNFVMQNFPIAHWPEMVLIDGVQQEQVKTLAEVGPGKFFVNGSYPNASGAGRNLFVSTSYVIGTNPAGKEVRIGKLARALSVSSVSSKLTIRGIGFRRYANALTDWGTIYIGAAPDLSMENVIIEDASDYGIHVQGDRFTMQRCTIQRCGRKGVGLQHSWNSLVEYCRFELNNNRRFNYGPDGGAIKVAWVYEIDIRHNIFDTNQGHAVWFDCGCWKGRVYDNWFYRNYGNGIMFEISARLWAIGNVFIDNGILSVDADSSRQPHHDQAIRLVDSTHAQIWHNTIINAEQAMQFAESDRTISMDNASVVDWMDEEFIETELTWDVNDINVQNNAFVGCAGINTVQSCYYAFGDQRNIKGTGDFGLTNASNLYTRPDANRPARFANGRNGSATVVFWNLTGAPSGGGDTGIWTSKVGGESGSMFTTVDPILNKRAGSLSTASLAVIPPAGVPSDVQTLVNDCRHIPQRIGAGIFDKF